MYQYMLSQEDHLHAKFEQVLELYIIVIFTPLNFLIQQF